MGLDPGRTGRQLRSSPEERLTASGYRSRPPMPMPFSVAEASEDVPGTNEAGGCREHLPRQMLAFPEKWASFRPWKSPQVLPLQPSLTAPPGGCGRGSEGTSWQKGARQQ